MLPCHYSAAENVTEASPKAEETCRPSVWSSVPSSQTVQKIPDVSVWAVCSWSDWRPISHCTDPFAFAGIPAAWFVMAAVQHAKQTISLITHAVTGTGSFIFSSTTLKVPSASAVQRQRGGSRPTQLEGCSWSLKAAAGNRRQKNSFSFRGMVGPTRQLQDQGLREKSQQRFC